MTELDKTARGVPAPFRSRGHRVEFSDCEHQLAQSVATFFEPVLTSGCAVFVGTADQRERCAGALADAGVDVAAAEHLGRLIVLDADQLLAAFMRDGHPDAVLFHRVIDGVLDQAARHRGPIRVYGEMVSVLWCRGDVAAALRLEELWNDAAASRAFDLLCGYPASFDASASAELQAVCAHHTEVRFCSTKGPTTLPFGELSGFTEERVVGWELPAERMSGALARQGIRDLLSSWQVVGVLDEAELLVSELVTNAVVHAASPVGVWVTQRPTGLRIEVSDVGAGQPRLTRSSVDATGGRGLWLVDAFARDWGTSAEADRKSVWFELAI